MIDLYFVLPRSHFRPALYIPALDYVFSQLCFLPNYFSSGFPNYGTVS